MEIHGTGPVVFIDTPGIDDSSVLSEARIARTARAINKADLAIVVVDAEYGEGEPEAELYSRLERRKVPYIVAMNKADLSPKSLAVADDRQSDAPEASHACRMCM